MKSGTSILLSFLLFASCVTKDENPAASTVAPKVQTAFESSQWQEKKGRDYPHRDAMLDDLVSSQRLKVLRHKEILNLLGPPDRTDSLYLFYRVDQKRIYGWPLHTKTLVIKLKADSSVHWVKIHK